MRFIFLNVILACICFSVFAAFNTGRVSTVAVSTAAVSTGAVSTVAVSTGATDSLIIQGKILNLTGRLYRQAPAITFSRNNILQPQLELSKQAPLAADGSFRVSLPMIYQQEEIYLDYSGKAFTTFLGSPGTIEIIFDGDSIQKAKRLFYFAGVNADANNQYNAYVIEENKKLRDNAVLGSKFYESFWDRSTDEATNLATKRAELRTSALSLINVNTIPDYSLKQWVSSIAEDERIQNLYEYSLANRLELSRNSALTDSLKRLSKAPLTAQRVTMGNRFGNYADQKVEEKKYNSPSRTSSLPVRLMASLIKQNGSGLTSNEITRLDEIAEKGIAEKTELDFINQLYAKNEKVLNLLFTYERESRTYADLFDSTAREFMKARYLPKNFYKYSYQDKVVLSRHIQGRLSVPQFRESLDEIVRIEVKDSADISKMIAFKDLRPEPAEALPGYYFSASNERGTSWLNHILEKYRGKAIYLIKWNLEDPKSREELEFVASLQAQVPEDVVFLYLHLPTEEIAVSNDLIKQYIVRHRLKGVHLFINNDQIMDLLFKLNPIEPGTFAILKPNGKYASKNAPAPSAMEKTVQAILQASSK